MWSERPGKPPIMTKQAIAIAIASKIAEIDALLADHPACVDWVIEVHPELSFLSIATKLGSSFAEGLPPKKRTTGHAARTTLIASVMPDSTGQLAAIAWPRYEVGRDDPLDAYAALWSAHRHGHAVSEILGGGERDERGLLQRMIV